MPNSCADCVEIWDPQRSGIFRAVEGLFTAFRWSCRKMKCLLINCNTLIVIDCTWPPQQLFWTCYEQLVGIRSYWTDGHVVK
jgi:hypothetical protein